ncbi:ABC-type transporter, integral membrane subunit [Desulfofundulus kuznetsovii DSM 6115]|uniref:ABC-type transporter, integral membrane subunit n=1 Tax=Desulfofundulus kuznetsovii (strain DSM 6115 / VKM B-1805 / 17) TaxID=760568 RepID=A0AAU8PDH2_DESK7|nr:ABC-type transporter, integral membrane subunit [Desulfofundulus kuznetsovii DSM 6115]
MKEKIDIQAKEIYDEITERKYALLLLLAVTCVLTLVVDILVGPAWLSIQEVFSAIFLANPSESAHVIVWTIRLPTALMAIAVGATLGIAGAEMQTILDNPLASPYTLGVSAGAGFGAALAIVLGVGVVPYVGEYLVSINAFFFSLLTCLIIYFIGQARKMTAETMVLAGIALQFLFHSLLALLQYIASEEALQAIVFWLFGSLSKTTWPKLGFVATVLIIIIPLLARDAWKLTALRLGDEKAKSLGIDVEKLRKKTLLLISLLTAAAVCFVGTIGFIGLVGPHIARMLVGEDQRFFIPMSALGGAVLLSAASIGSKVIIPGAIFPIGIVTSLIGIPFFFSLILTRRGGYW